ncbi:MAG: ABC transporter ATP-binding protein [Pyrinomonadaceae bacterium]
MLSARNITVRYDDRPVLSDVSFDLEAGEAVVLLGANGAGKTTLLRAINGTIRIDAGEIVLNDRSLSSMSRREVARQIAVVAQENETRFPIKVSEFVLSGRFVHGTAFGWESETDLDLAQQALLDCDLAGYGEWLMNHLSGGERQRVVLARALASGAQILLLDEPTANLDLAHQAMMFRLVRKRCRAGASAVVITHDLNLAAEFADRIVMLKGGCVAALGAPEEVLTGENVRNIFSVDALLDVNPASRKVRVTALYQ